MLVEYKVKNEKCLTKCIANHSQKIGSQTCCECKHFNGAYEDEDKHFIDCRWVESVLEKVSKNHPKTYMKFVTNEMLAKL